MPGHRSERYESLRKKLLISSIEEVQSHRAKIIDVTNTKLSGFLHNSEGMELLRQIKFNQSGFDPLFDEPLNFIEMTNQVFTYLVCLKAVELLLAKHPAHQYFINFGTESGYDVVAEDETIICECFAATTPDSNGKLQKDTRKVSENTGAENKYVVFYSSNPKPVHIENIKKKYKDVVVIALQEI